MKRVVQMGTDLVFVPAASPAGVDAWQGVDYSFVLEDGENLPETHEQLFALLVRDHTKHAKGKPSPDPGGQDMMKRCMAVAQALFNTPAWKQAKQAKKGPQ